MKIRIALLAGVALTMWGLKRYYADAPVDGLRWILAPTATLVSAVTAVAFEPQPGEGYVSRERLFVIEKACAGINFMIAGFGMTAWLLRRHATSLLRAADVLVVALVASYAAAVIVNSARITFALWLGGHSIRIGVMTAAQAHRVEGIVFYFGGLLLLHELIRCVDARGECPRSAA